MGKPRRINVVSVGIVLILVSAVYFAWKLIPPYMQASDVDTKLTVAKNQLGKHDTRHAVTRVTEVLEELRKSLVKLGVDDPKLEVGMEQGAKKHTIYAKYRVKVKLLFGQSITLSFRRSIKMNAEKL